MMPPHVVRTDIGLRPMTQADIPLGVHLAAEAGWNQTAADWRMLLDAGTGLVATYGTRPVGTATVVPYGTDFSWIGMVLVDTAYRRRRIGTTLLEGALAAARPYGCTRLDATPQGKPLYERLGFRAEYGLVRMLRSSAEPPSAGSRSAGSGSAGPGSAGPGSAGSPLPRRVSTGMDALSAFERQSRVQCRPLDPTRLHSLLAYDAPIFGAARGKILRALACGAPRYALACLRDDVLCGYCLGRSGARYEQIGPVVADSREIAQILLHRALEACYDRPVIVDARPGGSGWVPYLERLGFAVQRPFTRMALESSDLPGIPERQFAIAGPEMG